MSTFDELPRISGRPSTSSDRANTITDELRIAGRSSGSVTVRSARTGTGARRQRRHLQRGVLRRERRVDVQVDDRRGHADGQHRHARHAVQVPPHRERRAGVDQPGDVAGRRVHRRPAEDQRQPGDHHRQQDEAAEEPPAGEVGAHEQHRQRAPEHDRADRGEHGEPDAVAHRRPPVGIGDEFTEVAQRQRAARLVERGRPQRRPQHRDDRPDDERQREDPQPVLRHPFGQPAPLEPPDRERLRGPDAGVAKAGIKGRHRVSDRTPRSIVPRSPPAARAGRPGSRRGSRCPRRPPPRRPAARSGSRRPRGTG